MRWIFFYCLQTRSVELRVCLFDRASYACVYGVYNLLKDTALVPKRKERFDLVLIYRRYLSLGTSGNAHTYSSRLKFVVPVVVVFVVAGGFGAGSVALDGGACLKRGKSNKSSGSSRPRLGAPCAKQEMCVRLSEGGSPALTLV